MQQSCYHINEIFYSLQGEGFWTGRPAVFVRFSGCNLKCPFCDTVHSNYKQLSLDEIVCSINLYKTNFVVLTGGEPSLFVDEQFISALHKAGKYVAIETNGTHTVPSNIDWITLSPKDFFVENAKVILTQANEVKMVYNGVNDKELMAYSTFNSEYFYVQPCDFNDKKKNKEILLKSVEFCKDNPQWSLSLQTHKLIGVR